MAETRNAVHNIVRAARPGGDEDLMGLDECISVCLQTVEHCFELLADPSVPPSSKASPEHVELLLDTVQACSKAVSEARPGARSSAELATITARAAAACAAMVGNGQMQRCAGVLAHCARQHRRLPLRAGTNRACGAQRTASVLRMARDASHG